VDVIHFPDDARPAHWKQPVLALGNFDGIHRGHRKILDRLQRVASERRATSVVMTFDPHPPRVVRPDKAPPLLMTKAQKLEGLAQAGVDGAAIVRFTHELSQWEPETFVRSVLVEWLRVAEVWVGANFLFGHDRSGNFSLLRMLGGRYGFKAEKIDPVRYKDFVVSSTRVRRLVTEARVDEAAALLGHPYVVEGVVVRGAQRGHTIGFPTANLCTENELLPPHGVYATNAIIDGIVMPSVTNIGTRPTVDVSGQTSVETHIFDLDRDLYGATMRLAFVQRLRDERAFDSLDLLKSQIATDCARARVLFDRLSL
jgi:riboflavin kinase / FMN adenylyltransferase